MVKIVLGKGEDRRIRGGHPWVFSNEIREIQGERIAGAAAELFDTAGAFLGIGYYNPGSLIAFRLLSRERVDIDRPELYRERIVRAVTYRHSLYPGMTTYRAVYGEGDFLPGIVVDRYDDYLAVQLLTAGIDRRKEVLTGVLEEIFQPKGIIARNDMVVRGMEGLEQGVEVLAGNIPERIEIVEHGVRFHVDLRTGQKTGHFLDQKENHLLLEKLAAGKEMLDCFSYSGSWGLHGAAFGAAAVTCLDISERATTLIRENAVLNGLDHVVAVETVDVFDRLRSLKEEGKFFDIIVLDPPAFVKSRKALKEAEKGYLTINRRAMDLLRPGGHLITCSCSYHMGREMFRDILATAAHQARRTMRLIDVRSQAPDHPVLLTVPETEYLKCCHLQAV